MGPDVACLCSSCQLVLKLRGHQAGLAEPAGGWFHERVTVQRGEKETLALVGGACPTWQTACCLPGLARFPASVEGSSPHLVARRMQNELDGTAGWGQKRMGKPSMRDFILCADQRCNASTFSEPAASMSCLPLRLLRAVTYVLWGQR